ncbi:MAG: hydroxyacid dehydrogenase [Thermoprotei archaeon]|nr:MAG: hydroxyacid dehydrogenase [Thermoprotei archaeon]
MKKIRILVTVPKPLLDEISKPEDRARLESFAEVIYNESDRNLTQTELCEMIRGMDGCITSWGSPRFTKEVLDNADRLKIIGHAAGSVKPYVTDEVFRRGIVVVNAASVIAISVAEFTLALMLNCLRRIPDFMYSMKKRKRNHELERKFFTCDLRGKCIGIIGFGFVARRLVELLRPFEVRILVYDPYVPEEVVSSYGCEPADLDVVLRESDIVTIHAALTEETRHMIGERELRMMKRTAYLINTARGAIVDTDALVKALKEGWIAGAALDVFEEEPLPKDSPLYDVENVYLTPHIAGPSDERRHTMFGVIVEEMERFFTGKSLRYRVMPEELKFKA